MTYRALVVADDLTGAMDTGTEFATRGARTVVSLFGVESTPRTRTECDVLVADTDSRSSDPPAAARTVTMAIDAHPAGVVYKKIDSTLRGHIVPETDAAIDATDAGLAFFAPAFPATGRTTIDGTQLLDGVSVTETLDGSERPATAHLPTLLEGSSYPVVTCSTVRIERGPEAISERLSGVERPAIVVFDASAEAHLDEIARAGATASDNGERVLYVGSAGLARHVCVPGDGSDAVAPTGETGSNGERANGPGTMATGKGTVLGVAGSANPRTIEQVGTLPAEQVIALDIDRAVRDPQAAATDASARAIDLLTAGGTAVVTSAPDSEAIERARESGVAAGVSGVGERIERALAAVVETVCSELVPDGLVLTGGAVAVRVLRELGAATIRLTDEAVERGVPLGEIAGGRADGVSVITKAGGFGDERTIANCLGRLERTNE